MIHWSWWSIFIPLWIWKGIAIAGAAVGSYVWWRRPQSRLNTEEYIQYKAMLISLAVHLLLLARASTRFGSCANGKCAVREC